MKESNQQSNLKESDPYESAEKLKQSMKQITEKQKKGE